MKGFLPEDYNCIYSLLATLDLGNCPPFGLEVLAHFFFFAFHGLLESPAFLFLFQGAN
jgi:hypothetical protein